jgi:urease accessory protein
MSICLSERPVTNTSLGGHLRLECSARPDGTPFLSKQDFRVPVHIGKGRVDQCVMVLNIANPTAGFFDGDRVDIDVNVCSGASLCLSTPAASRVYPTRSGRPAANHQQFTVGENALLEWNPEPFIPHAGASYRQTTCIHLREGASLLFLEWLAPGRVAMGEVFAYHDLRWELDLFSRQRLLARERYDLRPDNESLEPLRARFPAAHYLSVYAAGEFASAWPDAELDALNDDVTSLGHGPLEGGVRVVRALCGDSISARSLARSLRKLLYQAAGRIPPALGRMPD